VPHCDPKWTKHIFNPLWLLYFNWYLNPCDTICWLALIKVLWYFCRWTTNRNVECVVSFLEQSPRCEFTRSCTKGNTRIIVKSAGKVSRVNPCWQDICHGTPAWKSSSALCVEKSSDIRKIYESTWKRTTCWSQVYTSRIAAFASCDIWALII
jgi:hypothetical protein